MGTTSTLDKTASFVLIAVLILMPIVSHAGGLGVAPLVFVLGVIGIILHFKSVETKLRQSGVFLTLAMFLIWLCITALWSPYHPDDFLTNYIKLFIIGLTFYFCPLTFKHVAKTKSKNLQRIFLTTTFLSAIFIFFDIVTGFRITLFFNPASTPRELAYRIRDAEMNLGHGLTVLVLLSAPMILLLKKQSQNWKLLATIFLALIITSSYLNNLSVGIIGTLAVVLVMFVTAKFPNIMPKTMLVLALLAVTLTPLLAFLSHQMMESDLTVLPLSWEHRIRMWAYCWPVIAENTIIGSGFDAVRTFDEKWIARDGRAITIVSLHPHNAGVHIWTEAGLIGCILAVSVIASSWKLVAEFCQTKNMSILISGILIAIILISSLTYGAWQFWWWGSVFFSFGLIHLIPMEEA